MQEDLFEDLRKGNENEDLDISQNVTELVNHYFWSIEKEMFFFTQPGVMNLTYPCTTTLGGTSPGRPCFFPITAIGMLPGGGYFNDTYAGCISYKFGTFESSLPSCYTKVNENNTVDLTKGDDPWGYCPITCKGELPSPSSPYNLAKSNFKTLWKSALYDLNIWSENGLCHTYDPPLDSPPDISNRIYFMTNKGHQESVLPPVYEIYIHQKGQFWPRSDMTSFGQPDHVIVQDEELELSFSVKEINTISKTNNPCILDEEYSFTDCLNKYAIKTSNCSLNFFGENQDDTAFCTKSGLKKYIDILMHLKREIISKIKTETGCMPKCRTIQYSYERNLKKIYWKTNWLSEVFIQPKSSVVEFSDEYYSFDVTDLFSSVGGNLGLILGWSLLSIVEAVRVIVTSVDVGKYLKMK